MDADTLYLLDNIEQTLLEKSLLGFNPAVLSVLDEVEIGQREIEDLKVGLGPDVFDYLFNIANSAYHGSVKLGPVKYFFEVVNRLGTQYTKSQILLFAMNRITREDREAKIIFAKNFAASVVGRFMARSFGFSHEAARKVELACLVSGIGELMMTVYRNSYQKDGPAITDEFIENNHLYLTSRIIRRYTLPDYLPEMIMNNYLILDQLTIALPGVVRMAIAFVDWSFQKMGNRLVIRSGHMSLDNRYSPSLAALIADKFASAGLSDYLIVLADTEQVNINIL